MKESFGDTVFGIILAIAICVFLFGGCPDVHDMFKQWLSQQSGNDYQFSCEKEKR